MAITINGDGLIEVGGTSTTQGRVRLAEDSDNGTNYVELQAPATLASNLTFTFPDSAGTSGQVLQTNGSGALSFANPGKVVQSVIDQQNARTVGANSWTTVPPATLTTTLGSKFLECSITPKSASNTIVIIAAVSALSEPSNLSDYTGFGIWKNNTGTPLVANYYFSTQSFTISGSNSFLQNISMFFTESAGSTTARTYSFYAGFNGSAAVINGFGSASGYTGSNGSSLIVLELAP